MTYLVTFILFWKRLLPRHPTGCGLVGSLLLFLSLISFMPLKLSAQPFDTLLLEFRSIQSIYPLDDGFTPDLTPQLLPLIQR